MKKVMLIGDSIRGGYEPFVRETLRDVADVPLPEYRDNVRAVLEALTRQTGARIVWATTTPVNTEWHHRIKGFDRFEQD